MTEVWDNKEPVEIAATTIKPKKKKKGVRMQFAEDVDIINAFNESPDNLDQSPVVVEVTQPAGVKPSRESFEITQLSMSTGNHEFNEELSSGSGSGQQRNRVSSIRLPPMNNSSKTSSNENGLNEKGGSTTGMIEEPLSSSGVQSGGLRLGIAGVGEGSYRSNKPTSVGGTSFSLGIAGHHYGNEDKTADLSPNEASITTNSRPPFAKPSVVHPTNNGGDVGDDDPNQPMGSSLSGEGGSTFPHSSTFPVLPSLLYPPSFTLPPRLLLTITRPPLPLPFSFPLGYPYSWIESFSMWWGYQYQCFHCH